MSSPDETDVTLTTDTEVEADDELLDDAELATDDTDEPGDDDDDVIVLPWWQHPVNILTLVVAGALIAGLIGWMVADSASNPDGGDVDIGFLQDMRLHHDQAVAMGFTYLDRPDTSPGLQAVARGIVLGQGIEIGRMAQMLRDFDAPAANDTDEAMGWMDMSPVPIDQMPGMASKAELDELAAAEGAEADQLFIDLMVAHHEGGLHMADFAVDEAESSSVREFAAQIADSQRDEILELERLAD